MTHAMLKVLKRIAGRKSVHDLRAWSDLERYGFIEISGTSDDITTVITEKGKLALQVNGKPLRSPSTTGRREESK